MCRFLISAPFSRRRGERKAEAGRMARSVSYVSAAKLLAMARGNPRVAIIDVRCRALASALRLSPTLRRADLVADVDEIVRFFLCVVGDCRDEERSYQAHIGGSHHFSSRSFAARLPELARATGDKDTVVFHCALSKVRGPSCAKMFSDYLSETKEESGTKNIMVLERGFNGWELSGQPVCRCTDAPCKGTCSPEEPEL
uniref:arsenate reductase (glutathione/glutaredoxin) n=1 Tax=Oryza nivara TaxID=4536 RepID=A0A0E0IVZ2_ORYNI